MDFEPTAPHVGRTLLTLTAAATIAVSPVAGVALGPADSGQSAHTIPVYLFARLAHDIGHNDWAFQGQTDGRVAWAVGYAALGLWWTAIAFWVRWRSRRDTGVSGGLWWRVWVAALGAEAVAGGLTIGAGLLAAWNSWSPDTFLLHAADLCSPWWSCVAAGLVAARAERSRVVLRATPAYGLLLAIVLVVPMPVPDVVRALILAVPAAVPALLTAPSEPSAPPVSSPATATPDAAAAG